MQGQRLGYVRVSSADQNPDRQLDGLALDRVFTDRASGKDTQRPQLAALLQFAREGDAVVVHSMDRLAHNLDDLRRLAAEKSRASNTSTGVTRYPHNQRLCSFPRPRRRDVRRIIPHRGNRITTVLSLGLSISCAMLESSLTAHH